MALAVHPFARAGIAQQLDRPEFKHAGANTLKHMRFRLPFEHDAVDMVPMQQMGQQDAGRAAADDRDLSAAHALPTPPRRNPSRAQHRKIGALSLVAIKRSAPVVVDRPAAGLRPTASNAPAWRRATALRRSRRWRPRRSDEN